MPCDDHMIRKLLLIYWEIVPKTSPDGKLLHEMILVCDAYRKVCWEQYFISFIERANEKEESERVRD